MKEFNEFHIGEGAALFAQMFIGNKKGEEALEILRRLNNGELHDRANKRIKLCAFCGFYFVDKRANKAKVCSRSCKQALDYRRQRESRRDKAAANRTFSENAYIDGEYSVYLGDSWLNNPREIPMTMDKLDYFASTWTSGERRKPKASDDYAPMVAVRYTLAKKEAEPAAEVAAEKWEKAEIDAYFIAKYGAEHMAAERRRATMLRDF